MVSNTVCPDLDHEHDIGHPATEHIAQPTYASESDDSSTHSTPVHWTGGTTKVSTSRKPCGEVGGGGYTSLDNTQLGHLLEHYPVVTRTLTSNN